MALQDHQLQVHSFCCTDTEPREGGGFPGVTQLEQETLELNPGLQLEADFLQFSAPPAVALPSPTHHQPEQETCLTRTFKSQGDGINPMDSRGEGSHSEVFRA